MADQEKQTTLHDAVFGDPQGIFANPDPHKALDAEMPSWMTDNLLDSKPAKPAVETAPKEA